MTNIVDGSALEPFKMVLDVTYICVQPLGNNRPFTETSFVVSKSSSQTLIFFKRSLIYMENLPHNLFLATLKCVSIIDDDTSSSPPPPIFKFTPIVTLCIVCKAIALRAHFSQINRARVSRNLPPQLETKEPFKTMYATIHMQERSKIFYNPLRHGSCISSVPSIP